jgi:hypothetical protein
MDGDEDERGWKAAMEEEDADWKVPPDVRRSHSIYHSDAVLTAGSGGKAEMLRTPRTARERAARDRQFVDWVGRIQAARCREVRAALSDRNRNALRRGGTNRAPP